MENEPVTLMALINTAIGATVGVLTITGAVTPELGGALAVALGAWVTVGAYFFVRPKVASPLTQENLAKELAEAQAKNV